MSDDSDMEDVGFRDASHLFVFPAESRDADRARRRNELFVGAAPDVQGNGSNNNNGALQQQQHQQESVTEPPTVASQSRTHNMDAKRELTKSFLDSYDKWKSYEEVLHTLEKDVDPKSIEMKDVNLAMGYILHLIKCEKKGMLPRDLPTLDDYEYGIEFEVNLGCCEIFKDAVGQLPGHANLDAKDPHARTERVLMEFIETEKYGKHRDVLVAKGILSDDDDEELDDNNSGEEQKQQQGEREDDTKMQQDSTVQIDSGKMELEDSTSSPDSKHEKKTKKSPSSISLDILMDHTSSEEKEMKLPLSVSLEKLQEVLFQPGMKFRGHIFVPGIVYPPDSNGSDSSDEEDNASGNEVRDAAESSNEVNSDNNASAASSNHEGSSSSKAEQKQNDGKPYELVVTERGVDPLGNAFIAASHAAYGDKQHVRIQVTIKEEEGEDLLWVDYSDGETCCSGYWNSEKFCFEGNVRQRMVANDGVFQPSAVTHVFTLYPCTCCFPTGRNEGKEILPYDAIIVTRNYAQTNLLGDILSRDTAAIAAHRNRTYMALQICLQNFVVLVQVRPHMTTTDMRKLRRIVVGRDEAETDKDSDIESRLDEKQQLLWQLRDVSFADLLTGAAKVGGEKLCADLRSRAALLDSMQFETIQDRLDFVTRWKEKEMDLKAAHNRWDTIEFVMKALEQMMNIFESSLGIILVIKAHNRLHASYECLENAYRRAEKRLPKDVLAKFEVSTDQLLKQIPNNTVCIICQMPVLEDADGTSEEAGLSCIYKFPCSHCFHKECAQQWLHNNSTCPSCRLDLTAKQTMNT